MSNETALNERDEVLGVEGITKRFPGVLANDHVDLTLHKGEILALLGENGAGKSTLMNVIYGLYHADEGKVRVKGQEIRFASPREAIARGIGMVHQHFQLIPVMTVAENVILGEEQTVDAGNVPPKPLEETAAAGTLRLIWGVLWRALIPIIGAIVGWLVALLVLQLILAVSTYSYPFSSFDRSPLVQKATWALALQYAGDKTTLGLLLNIPVLIGCLVGGVLTYFGMRSALRTWRGRARITANPSRVDAVIDALIDLAGTTTRVQNQKKAAQRVRDLSQQFGLEVDPNAIVEELPVGLQQRVEIVKALYRHADILILDEPTAVLTPQEGQELFRIMKDLSAQGVSIIFITHKLKEVLQVADSIVVMRGGKVVGSALPKESTERSLAAMMVGRELERPERKETTPGQPVLTVSNLRAQDERGVMIVDGVSFEVREGEVLGIAGVQGNGQTELVEVLTGLRKSVSGDMRLHGKPMTHASPRQITIEGACHIPEDRQRYGMVKPFSVADNLILNRYFQAPYSARPTWRQLPLALVIYGIIFAVMAFIGAQVWGAVNPALVSALRLAELDVIKENGPFLLHMVIVVAFVVAWGAISHIVTTLILNRVSTAMAAQQADRADQGGITINQEAITQNANQLIQMFDIRTPSPDTSSGNLSGGNQQKMIVAREFNRQPRVLIASQPTRGIDVGSIEFIHKQILRLRDEGTAVLLVSAELDEIMELSDRIAVMYRGHIVETLAAKDAAREHIGLLMASGKAETVPA